MAVYDTLSLVQNTTIPNGPVSRLFHFLLPAGDIVSARLKVEGANVSDDVVFNLAIDGVAVTTTELTMASGTNEIEALSLSETVSNDQWATVSIDSPFTSGSLNGITAIGFHITYTTSIGVSDGDKGDITVSGATWTIDNDVVTYAKMQNVSATDRLLGRDTAGAGDVEELTVGGGVEFTGTGIQRSALTGDVTATAGSNSTTIANNAVTTAKILDANVTLAKIANAAANSKLLGSGAAGSGAPYAEITLGTGLSMSGTTLNSSGGSTVSGGSFDIDCGDATGGGDFVINCGDAT